MKMVMVMVMMMMMIVMMMIALIEARSSAHSVESAYLSIVCILSS